MSVSKYLDHQFYKDLYPDLQSLNDRQLVLHYERFGANEGRIMHSLSLRENLIEYVHGLDVAKLEIGPFFNPLLTGAQVKYFDVLDQSGLVSRAKSLGYPTTKIPKKIHFVSSVGDLSEVKGKFGLVLSCHCIEHQPDFIRHIQGVEKILEPNGCYYLVIPDKRYCFDALLPCSKVSEVIEAFKEKRRLHPFSKVFEHRSCTTHNDSVKHWDGHHGVLSLTPGSLEGPEKEFNDSNGGYIDVHSWQFTPDSFLLMINSLHSMNLIKLRVDLICGTPKNRQEFVVRLAF